jgi:hypothetical protein
MSRLLPSHPFDCAPQGSTFVNSTNAQTGTWYAIQVIADAVFSAMTGNIGGDTFTGVTIPAGAILYGTFTAFTLTSGKVIAYKQ